MVEKITISQPSHDDLLAAIDRGVVILTPTHRYARQLSSRLRNNRQAIAQGSSQILSADQWVEAQWRHLAEQGKCPMTRLLSPYERQTFWRDLVDTELASKTNDFRLIQPQVASGLAQRCREMLKIHCVPWSEKRFKHYFEAEFDTRVFYEWLCSSDRLLRSRGWTLKEDLYEIVAASNTEKTAEVWVLNHPSPSPALKAALNACFDAQVWFELAAWGEPSPTLQFETKAQELKSAAEWAAAVASDKGSNCAIVLSNYQQDRPEMEYRLREAFSCLDTEYTSLPVNFSRGLELSKVPVFRDLLLFLSLVENELPRDQVVALLQSPYLSGRERAHKFIPLIRRLFDTRKQHLSTSDIRAQLNGHEREYSLITGLLRARDERLHNLNATSAEWRGKLIEVIEWIQWPNQTALDSLEYQQVAQFSEILDAIELNPGLGARFDLSRLIQELQSVLKSNLFQPKTDDHRVSVLALQDATGLQFDSVRIVGASSQQLPSTVAPLAFIPRAIKQEFAIDIDDMLAEQNRVGKMLERLRATSAEFHLTVCHQLEGAEVLPSIYCGELTKAENNESTTQRWVDQRIVNPVEHLAHDQTFVLGKPHENKGGTGLLQSQADCGVQAWLKHRVGLKPLKTADVALNAMDRGIALHRALELLTKRLTGREAFLHCSQESATSISDEAARAAVDSLEPNVRFRVGREMLNLEQTRLKKTLLLWIDFEKSRSLDFEVEQREYHIDWQHNGLVLNVTADRIDKLETGERVIIDYKSSPTTSIAPWVKPDAITLPQLPAYALVTENVGTIGIASANQSDVELLIAGAPIGIPRVDQKAHKAMASRGLDDTEALLEHWDALLANLVDDYLNGELTLPADTSVCRLCDFQAVCRVRLEVEDDDAVLEDQW